MGANGNNEPQNKPPKKQSPASATRPKKYALEMWVEIETSVGIHTTPKKTLIVLILPSTLLITPTVGVPACT